MPDPDGPSAVGPGLALKCRVDQRHEFAQQLLHDVLV